MLYNYSMDSSMCASSNDVIGIQWYWVISGEDLVLCNALVIGDVFSVCVSSIVVMVSCSPHFLLASSVDVIHSFVLPSLNVRYDVIPGRVSILYCHSLVSGLFNGQCSELCGVLHSSMPISNCIYIYCNV